MAAESERDPADVIADRLDMTLPPVCAQGVAANLRLLDEHWARLRQQVDPAA